MGFEYLSRIMTSEEIISLYPLEPALTRLKDERDQSIAAILKGEDDRMLVIIGPCSADSETAVCDYVSRLGAVQDQVRDRLLLIPRIYTNKPRTTGLGYKGILHQPDPEKEPDMAGGLIALRRMHLRAMRESGLTAADEMLYPENHTYLADILSYVAVGARSVENQQHRLTASGVDIPVGMKNPTSGDLSVMLNAIEAAQHGHTFTYQGWAVRTSGNPLAHAVLRGSVNQHGQNLPNYHYEDLRRLADLFTERGLQNPACVIDTNHANSNKQYQEQPRIVQEVLHSRRLSSDIRTLVRGLMIESYLAPGSQPIGQHVYGKSITDACLGWPESEELILRIADHV